MQNALRTQRKARGGSRGLTAIQKIERVWPPIAVAGNCPVCDCPLGRGGYECVPDANRVWRHHECQMDVINERAKNNP